MDRRAGACAAGPRERRRPFRKILQRLPKIDLLTIHVERKKVAAFATPEAVKVLPFREDDKRRCLFLMKRAEPFMFRPALFSSTFSPNDVDDIQAFSDFGNSIAGHDGLFVSDRGSAQYCGT